MNTSSANIPELFYDIISRILPGVAITAGILILLVLSNIISFDAHLIDLVTSINFLFLVLAIAYLSGSLLGTISQSLDVIFRYSYNPAVDYLKIRNAERGGKTIAHYIETPCATSFHGD